MQKYKLFKPATMVSRCFFWKFCVLQNKVVIASLRYSPVSRLARLARSIYRDGPPANTASQEEKLRRVVSAKTLNEMKHMGLYEDPYGVEPVWPHAGMLILNPYLGCNFGCVYCFRSPEQASSTEWFLKGAAYKGHERRRDSRHASRSPAVFRAHDTAEYAHCNH